MICQILIILVIGQKSIMKFLKENKNANIRGLEISKNKVQECIAKGLTVIEGMTEKLFYKKKENII